MNKATSSTESSADITAETPTNPTVTFDTPIVRGSQSIASVELRRPLGGDLRGVSLADLAQMDVDAIAKVVPRISTPTLTNTDVYKLEAPDLMKLASEILSFLLPNDVKASLAA